jgi:hypothetical protein
MRRPHRRFAFRLALALGRLDVDAMLAEIPEGLLREWRAYSLLEPFGQPEEDRRSATLCAMTHGNASLAKFLYHPPAAVRGERRQTEDEMKAALLSL